MFEEILKTEYNEQFDNIRKRAMVNSYYKYGPLAKNYKEYKCLDAIANLEKRLQKYKETGNTEFLVDVANFAMIEFTYPSIEGAKFVPTGADECEVVGFGINQLKED